MRRPSRQSFGFRVAASSGPIPKAPGSAGGYLQTSWERGLSALVTFKEREGHVRVSRAHVEGKLNLGAWVAVQRKCRSTMSAERRRRLDEIGFVWDPLETSWEEGFAALMTFRAREGNSLVPYEHVEGASEFKLGSWVTYTRMRVNKIVPERKRQLDAIEFVWDPIEAAWEEGFAALTSFKLREGHCLVLRDHVEGASKYMLGNWVNYHRKRKDKIPAERRRQLDEIGFFWEPLETAWEDALAALRTFIAREGHTLVPRDHLEGEERFRLGTWVRFIRMGKKNITAERKQRLEEVGFIWEPLKAAWEEGLAALKVFKAREGHCGVRQGHVEGAVRLGNWVSRQRVFLIKRKDYSAERRQRLDEIGFIWDAPHISLEEGFAALEAFKEREGHCGVVARHVESGFNLGHWVHRLRNRRDRIPTELRQRLDAIGFSWKAAGKKKERH